MTEETVRKNQVIYLRLDVIDESGEILESNVDGDAFTYVHGQGIILPKLEAALDGLKIGDTVEVCIEPSDGYGERVEDALVTVPITQLDPQIELRVGNGVRANGPHGSFELYIVDFNDDTVTLDPNHPYAGKTLLFKAEVLTIRPAHHDEIWHRRVHPGGHHLMMTDSSYTGD